MSLKSILILIYIICFLIGLLCVIIDQVKFQKKCDIKGTLPAVSLKDRICAYILLFAFPPIIALLIK